MASGKERIQLLYLLRTQQAEAALLQLRRSWDGIEPLYRNGSNTTFEGSIEELLKSRPVLVVRDQFLGGQWRHWRNALKNRKALMAIRQFVTG